METKKEVVNVMQRDALYAYLELLNLIGEVPKKEVYENIVKIHNGEALDRITSLIELEHGKYEKRLKELEKRKKSSFLNKIYKFLKS
jgi:hypothetical protein